MVYEPTREISEREKFLLERGHIPSNVSIRKRSSICEVNVLLEPEESVNFSSNTSVGSLGVENHKPTQDVRIETKAKDSKVYTFEEAAALTEIGIFHYFLQLVCGLCLMSAVVDVMGTSVVMPFFNRDIPSTVAQQGFLASSGYLGTVLSSHAFGFLSDTWGRVKMLRATLALSFITGITSAFSVNIWMLILLRFLTGLVLSGCQAIVYSFLGEFHSKQTRTKYITMLSMFIPMGLMFIPAMGLAILPVKLDFTIFGMAFRSWRLFLLVICFLRVFAFIGVYITPESPKYALMQGDHEQALQILRKMFAKNTKKPQCEYPVHQLSIDVAGGSLKNITGVRDALKLIWTQTVPLFTKNRILHTMNICLMMFIMYAIAHGSFMWLPTMLKQQVEQAGNGYTTCEIMYLAKNATSNVSAAVNNSDDVPIDTTMFKVMIMIGASFTITYFIFSTIINYVGKRNLLFCWILVAAAASFIFQYVTDFVWSVVVFTFLVSLNSSGGIVSTVAMEFFPTNVSAMGMCLMMMIARIGSFAGSNFVGLMIYSHCYMMFNIYLGLCILIALLSLLLPSGSKKQETK